MCLKSIFTNLFPINLTTQNMRSHKIPVTVLSGFLGAGKTTVLNHILNNRDNMKVAVIVNDMSEVNIDGQLVEQGNTLSRTEEKLVQMSIGCICCTLRDDLVKEVTRLAQNGTFDYLLIEGTGIAEPLPIAQTFSYAFDELGMDLTQLTRLDTMVTVVDALNFEKDFLSDETLADRDLDAQNERNIVDLITDQIEFANVVILNKVDRSSPYKVEEIKRVIAKLNPDAKIIATSHGNVDPKEILNTGMFDFVQAAQGAGWQKELESEHVPETDEYGIGSFVYRNRRPFDLGRFEDFINNKWHDGILRSKGFFWIATQPNDALVWSQAGQMSSIQNAGLWWASLSIKERNQNPAFQANEEYIMGRWDKQFGDRMIELVFIGQDMPEEKIRKALDGCLCSDKELNAAKYGE
jgi:G3E family GTPase